VRHPIASLSRRAAVASLAHLLPALPACHDDTPAPTGPHGGPTTEVDVTFCRGLEPAWVAFQDGDGAWTRAQPVTVGQKVTFHRTFSSDRGGIATTTVLANGLSALSVRFAAAAELADVGIDGPELCPSGTTTLLGTVGGLASDEAALVSAGFAARGEVASRETDFGFTLHGLLPGPQTILATRERRDDDGTVVVRGFIVRRIPEQPDGATIPPFDFTSNEAFEPVAHTVTLAGLGGAAATVQTGFRSAHSENEVSDATGDASAPLRPYLALPAARLEPGELQSIAATTTALNNVTRAAKTYFRSPADLTLTFGAAPDAPQLEVVSSAPTARLRARFGAQADYDRLTTIAYQQAPNAIVTVGMTPAYAAMNAGRYDLVVPELSGVPGFDPRWALHAGAQALWSASRIGGTLGLRPDAVPTDGATRRVGALFGVVTP
jgi:hypothetical protein